MHVKLPGLFCIARSGSCFWAEGSSQVGMGGTEGIAGDTGGFHMLWLAGTWLCLDPAPPSLSLSLSFFSFFVSSSFQNSPSGWADPGVHSPPPPPAKLIVMFCILGFDESCSHPKPAMFGNPVPESDCAVPSALGEDPHHTLSSLSDTFHSETLGPAFIYWCSFSVPC